MIPRKPAKRTHHTNQDFSQKAQALPFVAAGFQGYRLQRYIYTAKVYHRARQNIAKAYHRRFRLFSKAARPCDQALSLHGAFAICG